MSEALLSLVERSVEVDRSAEAPLYEQLFNSLRQLIVNGTLPRGSQLPPTRKLADRIGVSRNTVVKTFNRLRSEGYVESRVGSGTSVSEDLPEKYTRVGPSLPTSKWSIHPSSNPSENLSLSKRAAQLMEQPLSLLDDPVGQLAFRPGVPAFDAFPIETWSKLTARRWRSLPPDQLEYGDPAGYPPLRKAIAKHLRTARGVRCEAKEVLIVSGVQQAITLVARTLLDPGDEVFVEDPGFPLMRAAFAAAGAKVSGVPIDEQGFDLAAVGEASSPRMVGVTPSHQYPLGVTMSPTRRRDLLRWCSDENVWILEDDYDSEFRYSGRSIAALQGMDNFGNVLYTGTFSKILFPALRIGYLVVPPRLVDPMKKMRAVSDRCPPRPTQMVLTDFIEEGHLDKHIRKMRTLYANRQATLIEALEEMLPSSIDIESSGAGLHLVARLPEDVNDRRVSEELSDHNIIALPLSFYAEHPPERGGLLLGYAGIPTDRIPEKVRHMADVVDSFRSRSKGT